jgi:hypothetical protein
MVLLYYLLLMLRIVWCAGGRCDITGSDEDRTGVGDQVQRTGDGQV